MKNRASNNMSERKYANSCGKKVWTPDEDELLRGLIKKNGTGNWSVIAKHLPHRKGKQCRERWFNHLDPNIKKGDWTPEEDRIIIECQQKYGNRWSKITKLLPGRTDNSVKNRWHSTMRAYSRTGKYAAYDNLPSDTENVEGNKPLTIDCDIPATDVDTSSECDMDQHDDVPTKKRLVSSDDAQHREQKIRRVIHYGSYDEEPTPNIFRVPSDGNMDIIHAFDNEAEMLRTIPPPSCDPRDFYNYSPASFSRDAFSRLSAFSPSVSPTSDFLSTNH